MLFTLGRAHTSPQAWVLVYGPEVPKSTHRELWNRVKFAQTHRTYAEVVQCGISGQKRRRLNRSTGEEVDSSSSLSSSSSTLSASSNSSSSSVNSSSSSSSSVNSSSSSSSTESSSSSS